MLSCVNKDRKIDDNIKFKKEILQNSFLKKKEWFCYIDSVNTHSFINIKSIDSISLYYMKMNTPSIIRKSKYIIWKNEKPLKNGEFDLFIPLNTNQFFFVSNGKRNVILNKIEIDSFKIKESKKVLLDLNKSYSLEDPCYQISKINHKVVNQNIVFKIQIFQSCFDKYFYKQINYSFL